MSWAVPKLMHANDTNIYIQRQTDMTSTDAQPIKWDLNQVHDRTGHVLAQSILGQSILPEGGRDALGRRYSGGMPVPGAGAPMLAGCMGRFVPCEAAPLLDGPLLAYRCADSAAILACM